MIRFFLLLLAMVMVLVLQTGTQYLLPYPWHTFNIFFIFLTFLLTYTESGVVVWVGFFLFFLLELSSQLAFGMTLGAGTVSMLIVYWAYRYFFTNRSWYATMSMTAFGIFLYRFLYLFMLFLTDTASFQNGLGQLALLCVWEIGLSALVAGGIQALLLSRQNKQPAIFFIK